MNAAPAGGGGGRRRRSKALGASHAPLTNRWRSVHRCTIMGDVSKRAAARQRRLAAFPGEGMPPSGTACQLLCEDHVGTYVLPYLCHWSDGTWRNVGTGAPVKTGVVGWRIKSEGIR
jgi:hypothetical protein